MNSASRLYLAACIVLLLPPILIELVFDTPLPPRVYLGYLGSVSLLLLPFAVVRPRLPNRLVFVAFVACMLLAMVAPWTPRKPFLNTVRKVKSGMTERQVRSILRQYPAVEEFEVGLTHPSLLRYKHSVGDSRYANDLATVYLVNRRVTVVKFRR